MEHSEEFATLVEAARAHVKETTIDNWLSQHKAGSTARLIDVREDDEWRAGHLPDAEHIGRGVLERDIVQKVPDKNAELVLYCGGGFRSVLAAESLQKIGYTKVRSLIGGFRAWKEHGLPLTPPEKK